MVEPLVMPFVVVVRDEPADGATPRALADQDHALEAGVLDGAHEALRVGVQVTWNDERIRAAAGGARRSRCGLHGNVRVRPRRVRQIRDRSGYPDCDRPGTRVDVGGVQTGGIRIRF